MESQARTHPSKRLYFVVIAILLALTWVTVTVSRIDLGAINTLVALSIAGVKAVLVALIFMHLRSSERLTRYVAAASLLWLAILLVLTLADFVSRSWYGPPPPA